MSNVLRVVLIVIIATIGAFFFKVLYVNSTAPAPAAAPAVDKVRAAAADLPEGLLLRETDLTWKTVPHNSAPAGAIVYTTDGTTDFKGNVLRHAVTAGTVIVTADTLSPSSPGFLAAALKPGMRAVSVGIDDVSGNAGLIQPGDFVDLLLTQQIDTKNAANVNTGHSFASETVVSRVRVLAVGSEYQRPKSDSEANTRARTVTLEVMPETAQVIAVASRLGSLSLALRSFAVSDREPASGATPEIEHPLPPVYASEVSRALSPPPSVTAAKNTDIMVYRGSDAPVTSQSPAIDHSAEKAAKAQDAQNAQIAAADSARVAALNSTAAAANKLANKIPSFGPNKLGY